MLAGSTIEGQIEYRGRVRGGAWSAWSEACPVLLLAGGILIPLGEYCYCWREVKLEGAPIRDTGASPAGGTALVALPGKSQRRLAFFSHFNIYLSFAVGRLGPLFLRHG